MLQGRLIVFILICFPYQTFGYCPFGQNLLKSSRRKLDEMGTPIENQIPEALDSSDPLVVANDNFHANYDRAKSDINPQTKIMAEGDYLVLHLRNGSRIVEQVNTMTYHNLKMVSHLPLNAYIILLANTSKTIELETPQMQQLSAFLELLQNITLDESQFDTEEQLKRQIYIQNRTMNFVAGVINLGQCSFDKLVDFAWDIAAYATTPNLDDAAEIAVNNMHDVVTRWKENVLSESEWQELYTVSMAG